MRLILHRPIKVAGVILPAGTDVTDLSKDYLASIEHNDWAEWKEVEPKQPESQPEVNPEVKEEIKPVEQVAKSAQRPQRKPKK